MAVLSPRCFRLSCAGEDLQGLGSRELRMQYVLGGAGDRWRRTGCEHKSLLVICHGSPFPSFPYFLVVGFIAGVLLIPPHDITWVLRSQMLWSPVAQPLYSTSSVN